MKDKPKLVLAYSGGLDTTYCAVYLREQGYDVYTVTVQTGGFDEAELKSIAERAGSIGVVRHEVIDARTELFEDYLRYLIFANALRGDLYPLCVSAERVVQAKRTAQYAVSIQAAALAHGSTGAGNDQIRFDVAYRVFAPDTKIITPIRDQALTRGQEVDYLAGHGVEISSKIRTYSVNRGLWGCTIGGGQTHRSDGVLPESAYEMTASRKDRPTQPQTLKIEFDRGVPTKIDGQSQKPVDLIGKLNDVAGRHGVGRGMHVGDTILGIKGRVAFEAPGAVTLIGAHRELEKLVLSRQQLFWKRTLGEVYGAGLHEARFFDPLMRDIESFLTSSQQCVSGCVTVELLAGSATVLGVTSPHSLMNRDEAIYGEESSLWSGSEASAFAKIYGMQDWLTARSAPPQM